VSALVPSLYLTKIETQPATRISLLSMPSDAGAQSGSRWGRLQMSAVVIRILLCGLAGAIVGYLAYGGLFSGFALGLFVGAAVLLWLTQRNLPHPVRPRSPLPPMQGP